MASKNPNNSSQPLTHIPPQALEMEKSVLGSLMVDESGYDSIDNLLIPDSFYDKKHQLIFEAISDLFHNNQPFDALAVKNRLEKNGTFNKAGGMVYLSEILREATGSAGIRYHAEVIAEKYIKRQLISCSSEVQTDAFDDTVDSEELLQKAQERIYKISESTQRNDYTQINQVIEKVKNDIAEAAKNKGGLSGIPSLFHKIDKITSGWQNSDLIIIAARPAMGKTAFALSMARNIAVTQRIPMAFFSLEMSNEQLVKRLVSNVCELEANKLRSGLLEPHEWTQLDTKIGELTDAPLYVDDTSSLSIFELRTKARRLVKEHGVKIIMIDYLQLMTASGIKFGNRQEEVSHISRNLKSLAKELNIPIIALSQLNRGVDKREGEEAKRPQLSDLRESGAIEQDADMVCFIHRPEYYKIYESPDGGQDYRGKAEIIIGKHRNGEVGIVLLRFKAAYTRFMNLDDDINSGSSIMSSSRTNHDSYGIPEGMPPEYGVSSPYTHMSNDDPLGERLPNDEPPF